MHHASAAGSAVGAAPESVGVALAVAAEFGVERWVLLEIVMIEGAQAGN